MQTQHLNSLQGIYVNFSCFFILYKRVTVLCHFMYSYAVYFTFLDILFLEVTCCRLQSLLETGCKKTSAICKLFKAIKAIICRISLFH